MASTKTGGCACGYIRYTLNSTPLIIHCCYCNTCQRATGSAFVLNLLIESKHVSLDKDSGKPIAIRTPSCSSAGQLITRCPKCYVAVWSNYAGAGPYTSFVRVGTLDEESKKGAEPDVHIYTESKAPWMTLPEGVLAKEKYYDLIGVWSEESLKRLEAMKPMIAVWRQNVKIYWKGEVETVVGEELDKLMATTDI